MGDGANEDLVCAHQTEQECSDQGLCDRATGLCSCFPGYTGSSCQRTACPDDCLATELAARTGTLLTTGLLPKPSKSSKTKPTGPKSSGKITLLPMTVLGTLTCIGVACAIKAIVVQVAPWSSAPRQPTPLMTNAPAALSRTTSCNTMRPLAAQVGRQHTRKEVVPARSRVT